MGFRELLPVGLRCDGNSVEFSSHHLFDLFLHLWRQQDFRAKQC